MERITFKKLKARVDEINADRGIQPDTIGALKAYSSAYGCAVDVIINESHGVSRLFGSDTARNCMKYLNSAKYIDDLARCGYLK